MNAICSIFKSNSKLCEQLGKNDLQYFVDMIKKFGRRAELFIIFEIIVKIAFLERYYFFNDFAFFLEI